MSELLSCTASYPISEIVQSLAEAGKSKLNLTVIDISEMGLDDIFQSYPIHDYDVLVGSLLKTILEEDVQYLEDLGNYLEEADIIGDEEMANFLARVQKWCDEEAETVKDLLNNINTQDENYEFLGCAIPANYLAQVIVLFTTSI